MSVLPSPSLAVIDDHEVIHAGIRTWCAHAEPPLRVVGAYTNTAAFLAAHSRRTPEIDVVVIDLELRSREPDFTALQAVIDAGHRSIVYSHLEHDEIALRCLDLGAETYLAKSEGRTHLIDAVRTVAEGDAYMGPLMAVAISRSAARGRPNLSEREIEVLKAWFQTENKDIVAQRLHLETTTIKTHLQRIRAKYAAVGRAAPTKADLLARTVQDGLLGIDDF